MAKWNALAAIANPNFTGPATGADAIAAATAQLSAVLTPLGWAVTNVTGTATYSVGEWVLANRQVGGNAVADYGRIIDNAGTLQVEFGDGTRRGINTVVRRVE